MSTCSTLSFYIVAAHLMDPIGIGPSKLEEIYAIASALTKYRIDPMTVFSHKKRWGIVGIGVCLAF